MSQDIVSDTLNLMMNAIKANKNEVRVKFHSKFLLSVLAIAKLRGYVKEYKIEGSELKIIIDKLNACKAIKPRYTISVEEIDKHIKRYLPAKNIGVLIISTTEGLMTHHTAIEKNLGGSLIAYLY